MLILKNMKKLRQQQGVCVVLIVLVFSSCKGGELHKWTAGDGKQLWCPTECLEKEIDLDKDHCCACDGVPEWKLRQNIAKNRNVNVELLSVDNMHYKIFPLPSVELSIQNKFIFTNGGLRTFPINLCNMTTLVQIDISDNLITQISDISRLVMLDTLI